MTTKAPPDGSGLRVRQAKNFTIFLSVYVLWWTLEGAGRKWVFSGGEILYLIRDLATLGVILLLLASKHGSSPVDFRWLRLTLGFATAMTALTCVQLAASNNSGAVAVVGLRNMLSAAIVIGLIASVRETVDSATVLRTFTLSAPFQAVIVGIQVVSPPASWWNQLPGGEQAYFTTADGVVRASGTFVSPLGLTLYTTILFAVSVGLYLGRWSDQSNRVLLLAAGCSVAIATLAGSRGLLLNIGLITVVLLIRAIVAGDAPLSSLLLGAVAAGALIVVSAQVFPTVVQAFSDRITGAGDSAQSRLFESAIGPFQFPFLLGGSGIGQQSSAGTQLGSGEVWIEDDATRWVAELGLLGLAMVGVRYLAAVILIWRYVFSKRVDPLRAALGTVAGATLLFGSVTGEPASQGAFGIVVALLLILPSQEPRKGVSDEGAHPVT